MSLIINPYSFAATGVTPVLDTYGSAAAAYSVRKVRTAYTGSCLRVRRSNDNTESDIGFDGSGNLDESALTTFVGANSGYVTKWYDQSGNGEYLIQETSDSQPRIVNAGTIDKLNSKPAIYGPDKFLSYTQSFVANVLDGEDQPLSVFALAQTGVQGGRIFFVSNYDYENEYSIRFLNDGYNSYYVVKVDDYANNVFIYQPFYTWSQNTTYILQHIDTGTYLTAYKNGGNAFAESTADVGQMSLYPATVCKTSDWNYQQELIFYKADKSSDRTGIRDNINSYFGVY